MDLTLAEKIAGHMTRILIRDVWPHVVDIADARGHAPKGPLNAVVGSGKATYHQYKFIDKNRPFRGMEHRIVLGRKMVQTKCRQSEASLWRSYSEMSEYGYFGGSITFVSLMAHTILHEAAHGLQVMCGERPRGQVHNEAFYRCLSDLHFACGHKVHTAMKHALCLHGITNDWPERSLLPEKGLLPEPDSEEPLVVGDLVAYDCCGSLSWGVITGVNPKSYRIFYYQGARKDGVYVTTKNGHRRITDNCPRPSDKLLSQLFANRQKNELVWIMDAQDGVMLPGKITKTGRTHHSVLCTGGRYMGSKFKVSREILRSRKARKMAA